MLSLLSNVDDDHKNSPVDDKTKETVTRLHKVATYISSAHVTPGLHQELQNIFDTYKVFPEVDVMKDYISPVPNSLWATGLEPRDIWIKHQELNVPTYCYRPIVILDDQTARDKTIVLVSTYIGVDGTNEVAELRMAPPMVSMVASNLEIANQTIDELIDILDSLSACQIVMVSSAVFQILNLESSGEMGKQRLALNVLQGVRFDDNPLF